MNSLKLVTIDWLRELIDGEKTPSLMNSHVVDQKKQRAIWRTPVLLKPPGITFMCKA